MPSSIRLNQSLHGQPTEASARHTEGVVMGAVRRGTAGTARRGHSANGDTDMSDNIIALRCGNERTGSSPKGS